MCILLNDVNSCDYKHKTLLHHFVEKQRYDIVLNLVDLGADMNLVESQKATPLHIALEHKDIPLETADPCV